MQKNRLTFLRAHHLLCIQGFQGYGYDEPFTKNLRKIHELFFKQTNLRLTFHNDAICKKCPFSTKSNKICFKRGFNPKVFDLKVSKIIGLSLKSKISIEKLIFYSNQNTKKKTKLKKLCKDCGWNSKCLWFLN